MAVFCKLARPNAYRACDWDLLADAEGRKAWLDIFDDHTASLLQHAASNEHPPSPAARQAYREAFTAKLNRLRVRPDACGQLDIYTLCKLRADMLREFGMGDPYERVKHDENHAALAHLPGVLDAVDNCAARVCVETLFRAALAGNKFDLGAKATTDEHTAGGIDFHETLHQLPSRPWYVDHLDAIAERLTLRRCPYQKAMFFVDNAGADVVLGAIPIARYLADLGCAVVLAANDEPALNDVTLTELNEVLGSAARLDHRVRAHLHDRTIATVGTGCDCPLIDLADVSEPCNAAAADCDLIILEGMGRAVETNYDDPFTCDVIHLAMIKNPHVAAHVGCKMFDLIVKFTRAAREQADRLG